MSIFFISDLHLEEKKPHLTDAFKNFINSKLSPKDELFILGDFFEQWIGDDYEDNFIKSIKEKYSARNPKTGELVYVPKKKKVRFRASKKLQIKFK